MQGSGNETLTGEMKMTIRTANIKTAMHLATSDVDNIAAQQQFASTYLDSDQSRKFLAVCRDVRENKLPAAGPRLEQAVLAVFAVAS